MCICHHGSIKGLGFLDIILLNGARFLFVCFLWPEFFFFFSLCVKHLFLLLKCSDVLALKKIKTKTLKTNPKCSYRALRAEVLTGAGNAAGTVGVRWAVAARPVCVPPSFLMPLSSPAWPTLSRSAGNQVALYLTLPWPMISSCSLSSLWCF